MLTAAQEARGQEGAVRLQIYAGMRSGLQGVSTPSFPPFWARPILYFHLPKGCLVASSLDLQWDVLLFSGN